LSGNKEDFEAAVKSLRAVMSKHERTCPVTNHVLHGEGSLRCALELGHQGEHMCMYTPHSAYLRRIAERIADNLCVRDGTIAWKSTEDNLIQGWDDSIEILQELIGVVLKTEREGPQPETYFYRSSN
jgi:hypothetical protein